MELVGVDDAANGVISIDNWSGIKNGFL
jgi:hypothetical protein